MKKIALLLLTCIGNNAFNQMSTKPEISLTINSVDPYIPLGNIHFEDKYLDGGEYNNYSFAVGLTGKYFLNETNAFRLRFIYTNRNINDYRDIISGAHSIVDENFKQTLIKFSPGYQWGITQNKISFFGGLEIPITLIGYLNMTENYLYETVDQSFYDEGVTTKLIPGGFSAGLGLFLGSNYFFHEHFGVGFELASAYQYTSVGGTITYNSESTSTIGTSSSAGQHEETIKQLRFSKLQANINFTFKF